MNLRKKIGTSIHPGTELFSISPLGNITLMKEIYSE